MLTIIPRVTSPMRLSPDDQQIIVNTFKSTFPPQDHLWLFGSRTDDTKRGGDIDLYIQTHLDAQTAYEKKSKYLISLWAQLGEQKIDIVTHLVDTDFTLPIYKIAQEQGIQLA